MEYYIKAYILEGCPYSIRAKHSLSKLKNTKLISVPTSRTKSDCIAETRMTTFPQIMLIYKNNNYIIGGNDDLENLLSIRENVKEKLFKNQLGKYFNEIKESINIKDYNIFLMTLVLLYQNNGD